MMDPTLSLQKLFYGRLTGSPDVLARVPAENISDVSGVPRVFPSVVIGEATAAYSDNYQSFHEQVSCDVHVWTEEPGLEQAKRIAFAVRNTLKEAPWSVEGHVCHGISVSKGRFLRDPSGEHGHAVLTIDAVLQARS